MEIRIPSRYIEVQDLVKVLRLISLLVALVVAAPVSQAAAEIPGPVEAALLLKLLSFETSRAPADPTHVRIGILFDSTKPISVQDMKRLSAGLKRASKKVRVKGRTAVVVTIDESDWRNGKLPNLDMVYLAVGIDHSSALTHTRRKRLITACGDRDVLRAGAVFGVLEKSGRPSLAINVAAGRAAKLKLDPRVARLIDKI